jgi:hypothetical protein
MACHGRPDVAVCSQFALLWRSVHSITAIDVLSQVSHLTLESQPVFRIRIRFMRIRILPKN